MKTLLLLRHAKSSWDNANLSDFDRPLNKRGVESAPLIGKAIRKRKLQPDLIFSSPAVRAKETIELVRESAGLAAPIKFEPGIYEASAGRLLDIVSRIPDEADTAMLVGHNPGFEDVLELLTREKQHLPTAALACVKLDVEKWSEVSPGHATLEWLLTPKHLKA